MNLTVRIDAAVPPRVHLEGRLDSDSAPDLDQNLRDLLSGDATGRPKAIVFDLGRLQYISSAGLRCFVRVMKAGTQPLLVNLHPDVEKVFNMVKVLPARNLFRDDDALRLHLAQFQA